MLLVRPTLLHFMLSPAFCERHVDHNRGLGNAEPGLGTLRGLHPGDSNRSIGEKDAEPPSVKRRALQIQNQETGRRNFGGEAFGADPFFENPFCLAIAVMWSCHQSAPQMKRCVSSG